MTKRFILLLSLCACASFAGTTIVQRRFWPVLGVTVVAPETHYTNNCALLVQTNDQENITASQWIQVELDDEFADYGDIGDTANDVINLYKRKSLYLVSGNAACYNFTTELSGYYIGIRLVTDNGATTNTTTIAFGTSSDTSIDWAGLTAPIGVIDVTDTSLQDRVYLGVVHLDTANNVDTRKNYCHLAVEDIVSSNGTTNDIAWLVQTTDQNNWTPDTLDQITYDSALQDNGSFADISNDRIKPYTSTGIWAVAGVNSWDGLTAAFPLRMEHFLYHIIDGGSDTNEVRSIGSSSPDNDTGSAVLPFFFCNVAGTNDWFISYGRIADTASTADTRSQTDLLAMRIPEGTEVAQALHTNALENISAGVVTDIPLDQSDIDSHGIIDLANNRFVPNRAGPWAGNAKVCLQQLGAVVNDPERVILRLVHWQNGGATSNIISGVGIEASNYGNAGAAIANAALDVQSTNDWIKFQLLLPSGYAGTADTIVGQNSCFFNMRFIGGTE